MTSPRTLAAYAELAYTAKPTYVENSSEVLTIIDADTLYCVFRGTTLNGIDILTDLRAMPWAAGEFGGARVHSGFYKAVAGNAIIPSFDWRGYSFRERLKSFFSPDDGIWDKMRDQVLSHRGRVEFVGHSKGAGEAQIAALLCLRDGRRINQVTGFGSPKVGGEAFKRLMAPLDVDLFRFGIDVVTEIPNGIIFDYKHVRELISIEAEYENQIQNHKISNYVKYVPMV